MGCLVQQARNGALPRADDDDRQADDERIWPEGERHRNGSNQYKYVLQKRGIIASSAQRKPGATITAMAKAEVDYLLSRVARVDRRANFGPQSSAAG